MEEPTKEKLLDFADFILRRYQLSQDIGTMFNVEMSEVSPSAETLVTLFEQQHEPRRRQPADFAAPPVVVTRDELRFGQTIGDSTGGKGKA